MPRNSNDNCGRREHDHHRPLRRHRAARGRGPDARWGGPAGEPLPARGRGAGACIAHAHAIRQRRAQIRPPRPRRIRRHVPGYPRQILLRRHLRPLQRGRDARWPGWLRYHRVARQPAVVQRQSRHLRPLIQRVDAVGGRRTAAALARRHERRYHPARTHLRGLVGQLPTGPADQVVAHHHRPRPAQARRDDPAAHRPRSRPNLRRDRAEPLPRPAALRGPAELHARAARHLRPQLARRPRPPRLALRREARARSGGEPRLLRLLRPL